MIQTILTVLIAIYFAYAFYESADHKRWLWALIGAFCFVVTSEAISIGITYVALRSLGMNAASVLLVLAAVAVGLYLGCVITNLVKKRYLPI
jgi:ABC-type glycerol-3-phosphate transport system permease component